MRELWCPFGEFHVSTIAHNLFLFQFQLEDDLERVLMKTWLWNRCLVVLRRVSGDEQFMKVELKTSIFSANLLDIPLKFRTKENVRIFVNKLGSFVSVEEDEFGLARGSTKVRFLLDLEQPLVTEINFSNSKGEKFTIPVEYDQLPNVCYYCGIIGHVHQSCRIRFMEDPLEKKPLSYESKLKPKRRDGAATTNSGKTWSFIPTKKLMTKRSDGGPVESTGSGSGMREREVAPVEKEDSEVSMIDCLVNRMKRVVLDGGILEQLQGGEQNWIFFEEHLMQSIRAFTGFEQCAKGVELGKAAEGINVAVDGDLIEEGGGLGNKPGSGADVLVDREVAQNEEQRRGGCDARKDGPNYGPREARDDGLVGGTGLRNGGSNASLPVGEARLDAGPKWAPSLSPQPSEFHELGPAMLPNVAASPLLVGSLVSTQKEPSLHTLLSDEEENPEEDPEEDPMEVTQLLQTVLPAKEMSGPQIIAAESMNESPNQAIPSEDGFGYRRLRGPRIRYTARKSIPHNRERSLAGSTTGKRNMEALGEKEIYDLLDSAHRKKRAVCSESEDCTILAVVAEQPRPET